MIISFGMTQQELLSGTKTVTRRFWKPSYIKTWQKAWDEGRTKHHAYDRSPRNGGKQVGWIELTERPYREALYMLPEADLVAEGGMCATLEEFCELVGKKVDAVACVVRFQFVPLSNPFICVDEIGEWTEEQYLKAVELFGLRKAKK